MEMARIDTPVTVEAMSESLHETDRRVMRMSALCDAVYRAAIDLPGDSPEVARLQALAEMARDASDAAAAAFEVLRARGEERVKMTYSLPPPVPLRST